MTTWTYGAMALAAVLTGQPALAGDLVIRDAAGREIGTIEPSPVAPGLATIRDSFGRQLGTVEDDAARQRAAKAHYENTLRTIAPARPDHDRETGRRR